MIARRLRIELALQSVFLVALLVDMIQTLDITRQCRELNPVIGPCGERVPVVPYFAAVAVGQDRSRRAAGEQGDDHQQPRGAAADTKAWTR